MIQGLYLACFFVHGSGLAGICGLRRLEGMFPSTAHHAGDVADGLVTAEEDQAESCDGSVSDELCPGLDEAP